jgi:parvulin-like peptidyl-prolyl isomerase
MTFRTRSAPQPTRRRIRRNDSKRAVYLTLIFTLAIVSSVALLGGVFAAGYYTDHAAAIANVNGETISKDAVRDRAAVNRARLERQIADYRFLRNQGHLSTEDTNTFVSNATTSESESTIYSDALTELINEAELRQYAAKNNITVSEQAVDAQIQTDATFGELRHVKVIAVPTKPAPAANSVTSADFDAALAKAQKYRQEVLDGKAWADVDTEATNNNENGTNGDLGAVTRDEITVDADLADAVFALLKVNDVTSIFKGTDGAYRFATVTSIVPKWVDNEWQSTIVATANGDAYRAYARAEALKKAVKTAVEAKYIYGPTTQRRVQEIAVATSLGVLGDGDEVKIKYMVMAPGHSTANAAGVATDDPAWAAAKTRADEAVAALRKDPTQWAKMAKDTSINDDTNFATAGGDLQLWLPQEVFDAQTTSGQTGLAMTAVGTALFKDGLAPGTILDPIQISSQGYVVAWFEGRRPAPAQRIANCAFEINGGANFATQAKTASESIDAPDGGELGWVSPYMLSTTQEKVVFSTPVGRVSNVVSDNGFYLFKVEEEQVRTPDAAQQVKLKKVVFSRWQTELQGSALVWQDAVALAAMAPSTSTATQ